MRNMEATAGTLDYRGLMGPCQCDYLIEDRGPDADRQYRVVIIQTEKSHTSVTNMMEEIVTQLLGSELAGVRPDQIEVIQFYPPEEKPIVVFQKVGFGSVGKVPVKGLFNKPNWAVGEPNWDRVDQDTQEEVLLSLKRAGLR